MQEVQIVLLEQSDFEYSKKTITMFFSPGLFLSTTKRHLPKKNVDGSFCVNFPV